MLKPLHFVLIAALLGLSLTACDSKKTAAQLQLEKEKAWRADKLQRSAKFYQILIDKYPDSPHAAEARQRLAAMGPLVGTPKPASTARPATAAAKPASPKPH